MNRPEAVAPARLYSLVVVAASAGGLPALTTVLAALPEGFPLPVAVVQHLDPRHDSIMAQILGRRTALRVKEATAGDLLAPGVVYVAPPIATCWSARADRSSSTGVSASIFSVPRRTVCSRRPPGCAAR